MLHYAMEIPKIPRKNRFQCVPYETSRILLNIASSGDVIVSTLCSLHLPKTLWVSFKIQKVVQTNNRLHLRLEVNYSWLKNLSTCSRFKISHNVCSSQEKNSMKASTIKLGTYLLSSQRILWTHMVSHSGLVQNVPQISFLLIQMMRCI